MEQMHRAAFPFFVEQTLMPLQMEWNQLQKENANLPWDIRGEFINDHM